MVAPGVDHAVISYRAFISYSHADVAVARRLHRRLESYRPPQALRQLHAARDDEHWRLKPVFLDREELATASELSESILTALDASAALVVVCSPAAVASKWVNQEIHQFRHRHPDRPVYAFVVAGDPALDPLEADTAAFPRSLLRLDPDNPQAPRGEPLAADARKGADGFSLAFLKLVAGLLAVPFDALRQRELRRQQRRWIAIAGLSSFLTLSFAVIAWQAVQARQDAEVARERAEIRLVTERETREFLLSVFRLADPSEARGNQITVREVLDQAVARIESTEFSTPLIKGKFLATMAQAYANLGLSQESLELFANSNRALDGAKPQDEARQQEIVNQISRADVQFAMGDYELALSSLAELQAPRLAAYLQAKEQIDAQNIRGDIASYLERDAEAESYYQRALELLNLTELPQTQRVSSQSRAFGGLALLAHFAGDPQRSEQLYREATELLLPVFGENHPDSIWAMTSLGSAAYANGNAQLAQATWERLLPVALLVYDADHPEIATLRNSLGLLALEQGRYETARLAFEDAVRIDRLRRTERFDDLVYPLSNLALVETYEGRYEEAETLLAEAADIAFEQSHRWLGPVLTRQADLACLQGRHREGASLAHEAAAISTEEFGQDDWRTLQAKLTALYCLGQTGEVVDMEAVEANLEAILVRWGEANCYSQRALDQALFLYAQVGDQERMEQRRGQRLGWSTGSLTD